ncbi:cellulase family glycosylhydrolase [Williamsia sp. MIQD14]|uniref:cellulase family glycosylhydrolase n=1 Tax=Williamsia sp. MIQD14 TaxID=3425703 RepID=UPI003DA15137
MMQLTLRSRWMRLVMTAATVVGIATTAAAPAATAAGCAPTVGVSPGASIYGYSDADLNQTFAQMRALGATWTRIDIAWSSIEANRGVFTWGTTDRLVNAARAQGLKVLGIVAYTPRWARAASAVDSDKVVPANPADFGAFAGRVASHYGNALSAYEIWNEPNLQAFFMPRVDPGRYVQLLAAASTAIRRVNGGALIVGGSVTGAGNGGGNMNPVDFVRAMYGSGAAPFLNVVSVHPYSYPFDPSDTRPNPYNYFNSIPAIHATMVAGGDAAKSIWITEFGAPTGAGTNAVSPAAQSAMIVHGVARARQFGYVGNVFIYSLRDAGPDVFDREQNFGLRYSNGSPKPAYTDLRAYLARCGAPR